MKVGDMVWTQVYGGSGFIPSEVEIVYIYGDECVVKFEEEGNLRRLEVGRLNELHKEKPIPNKVREVAAFISNAGNDPLEIAEHLYYGGWIK